MNRPINLIKLFISFSIIFSFASSFVFAEQKTDFKANAKIIGVADPDFKEYSYIDMGTANGVKTGDRFMVQGKYGKVMVEVVQSFQRMASVRIVDSWLLGEGNNSEKVASTQYPKIKIAKYIERKKIKLSSPPKSVKKKTAVKSVKKPVIDDTEEVKKAEPEISALPGESSPDAFVPEADAGVPVGEPDTALPGEETIPTEPGMDTGADMFAEPGTDAPADDMGTPKDVAPADMPADDMGLPADDMGPPADDMGPPADDMGLPADDMGPPADDMGLPADDMGPPADDMGLPADDMGLPADDMGPPADDMGLPADDMGLPADDMGAMPGDALPPLP